MDTLNVSNPFRDLHVSKKGISLKQSFNLHYFTEIDSEGHQVGHYRKYKFHI